MEMEKKVLDLNLDDILPNRFQPRIKFDEEAINELAESIKEYGVIQPVIVRKIGDKYEIIAGERRYKASIIAGKATIPAIITDLDDQASAEIALIENVQREDLTPIEEAVSYRKILDMGYLTQEELANKLDRNQSTIANKLRLLNLDETVQEALLNEKISERHARSLLRLNDSQKQRDMLSKIIDERMTVRKTDEAIDYLLNNNNKPTENQDNNYLVKEKEEVPMNNNINNSIFNIPSEPIIEEAEIKTNNLPIDNETKDYNPKIIENVNDAFQPEFIDFDKLEKIPETISPEFMDFDQAGAMPETISSEFMNFDQTVKTPETLNSGILDFDQPEKTSESLSTGFPEIDQDVETPEMLSPGFVDFNKEENNTPIINSEVIDVNQTENKDEIINPGFMDVDKIEKEAKDIYVEKPVANINTLLQPTNGQLSKTEVIEDDNKEEDFVLKPGRFFNLGSEKIEEPVNSKEKDDAFTDKSFINNQFNYDLSPVLDDQEESEDGGDNKEILANAQNIPSIDSTDMYLDNTTFNDFFNPVIEDQVIHEDIKPNTLPEVIGDVNVLTIPSTPVAISNNIDTISDFGEAGMLGNNNISAKTGTYVAGDLKTVINTIRDCASTIEKYGFIVDTEELDFEESYQVTFKIVKK